MAAYNPPVLNQIAFAVGEGWVMFWPVWLVAAIVSVFLIRKKQRAAGLGLAIATAIPLAVLLLFLGLLALEVDAGPRDGLVARILDAAGWAYIVATGICALGCAATLGMLTASAFNRRSHA